jgi:hypothetical protein
MTIWAQNVFISVTTRLPSPGDLGRGSNHQHHNQSSQTFRWSTEMSTAMLAYAEKTSWNTVSADLCERKHCSAWKNKLKNTDYKPAELDLHHYKALLLLLWERQELTRMARVQTRCWSAVEPRHSVRLVFKKNIQSDWGLVEESKHPFHKPLCATFHRTCEGQVGWIIIVSSFIWHHIIRITKYLGKILSRFCANCQLAHDGGMSRWQ